MIARTGRYFPAIADWLQAGAVALALFTLYAATAPRTVALEDDGLFVLSSYFLGVEHPPGYPLYILLGKLFTYLPFGSVAYRVHLLSGALGGLTCGLLWMCARTLLDGRLAAYVAAFALGVTPVFWSQAIIAEAYTLNTLFFAGLLFLALRACPPARQEAAAGADPRLLPWMALLFGLSLSNHWPLMLLVAPAFAILLWPLRAKLVRWLAPLLALVILGLLPYAWLVWRSQAPVPVNFDGPLETLPEIWFFISRAGYSGVDQAPSADWLDRMRFFRFMGSQLFYQFAVLGTALAAIGFAAQWRLWGRRVAAALTTAFVMPSFVLLLMLNFEYNAVAKHTFHVYPLPAYAAGALWVGLGLAWLVQRFSLQRAGALALGAAPLALIAALGMRSNLLSDYDWAARYAHAVLGMLPKDAILFVKGDADAAALAYFHLIEGMRPDVTLYHGKGLVFDSRLFHPLRTTEQEMAAKLHRFIEDAKAPVAFTAEFYSGNARRDRWLHIAIDRSSRDPNQVSIEIPEEAIRFFEESVLGIDERNPWIAYHQDELRRRYGMLLGMRLRLGVPLDERAGRHLKALSEDFHGAMGLAEGLMANKAGYSAGAVADMLERSRALMPADVTKLQRSKYFFLRGLMRLDLGDRTGAVADLETAYSLWPVKENPARAPLRDLQQGGSGLTR
jgi:hypothetical protein